MRARDTHTLGGLEEKEIYGRTADKYNEEINFKTSGLRPNDDHIDEEARLCTCTSIPFEWHSIRLHLRATAECRLQTQQRSERSLLFLFVLFYCNMNIVQSIIAVSHLYCESSVRASKEIMKIHFQFVSREIRSFIVPNQSDRKQNINYSRIHFWLCCKHDFRLWNWEDLERTHLGRSFEFLRRNSTVILHQTTTTKRGKEVIPNMGRPVEYKRNASDLLTRAYCVAVAWTFDSREHSLARYLRAIKFF